MEFKEQLPIYYVQHKKEKNMILEEKYVYSNWKKGNLRCRINTLQKNGTTTLTFKGYNPFPCFEMTTTFSLVADWLKENGWKQYGVVTKGYVRETVDETGKIVSHYSTRQTYPVDWVVTQVELTEVKKERNQLYDFLGEKNLANEYKVWKNKQLNKTFEELLCD